MVMGCYSLLGFSGGCVGEFFDNGENEVFRISLDIWILSMDCLFFIQLEGAHILIKIKIARHFFSRDVS